MLCIYVHFLEEKKRNKFTKCERKSYIKRSGRDIRAKGKTTEGKERREAKRLSQETFE
jgi:hypothetical protein